MRASITRRLPGSYLSSLIGCQPQELRAALWGAAYFFCLLAGWYILRPLRDEMGIRGGVEELHWLFTGTFVAMLAAVPAFGWLSSRFPRRRLVPAVYVFFITNLLGFLVLFRITDGGPGAAQAFFIWTSVYNLFIISVFWSFLADLFSREQAGRLFGFVAAGGSAGAIAGPALATTLAGVVEPDNLLVIAAAFLALALVCVQRLLAWRAAAPGEAGSARMTRPMGGGIFEAVPLILRSRYLLGLCLLMLLTTAVSTFLYLQQARIVADAFTDSAARTRVFAGIDLAVNILAVLTQLFLTGRIVQRLGIAAALGLTPVVMLLGFAALGVAPVLAVLVVVQVLHRGMHYAVLRPAREMLFTVLTPQEKYKAKNFIDTVVYRGGDAANAWLYAGLASLGLGPGGTAIIALPIAAAWLATAVGLGRAQTRITAREPEPEPASRTSR